jgi:hypothetical protein
VQSGTTPFFLVAGFLSVAKSVHFRVVLTPAILVGAM